MKRAACAGMDTRMFFPEKGDSVTGNRAITVCHGCPVRPECREYKKHTTSTDGIWAGEYSKRGNNS